MNAEEMKRFEVREGRPGTGKGLFTRLPVKKGDFILEYTGKKIPNKIADEMSSRYLFEVDKKWTLDGPPPGNTAGYINHACEPNVEAEIEERDGEDRIMIYAERDIAAGEELTIDYGDEYFDEFIRPAGCKCVAPMHR
ncbi:SET domain-containing protein [Candidatus Kaiserbacteria bacterium]|nr:SET domain-containing protein [Candidatus Kaiserbacteria bacterium]